MDDLKLFARNYEEVVRRLTAVKEFSNDTGMDFGLYKRTKATFEGGKLR